MHIINKYNKCLWFIYNAELIYCIIFKILELIYLSWIVLWKIYDQKPNTVNIYNKTHLVLFYSGGKHDFFIENLQYYIKTKFFEFLFSIRFHYFPLVH